MSWKINVRLVSFCSQQNWLRMIPLCPFKSKVKVNERSNTFLFVSPGGINIEISGVWYLLCCELVPHLGERGFSVFGTLINQQHQCQCVWKHLEPHRASLCEAVGPFKISSGLTDLKHVLCPAGWSSSYSHHTRPARVLFCFLFFRFFSTFSRCWDVQTFPVVLDWLTEREQPIQCRESKGSMNAVCFFFFFTPLLLWVFKLCLHGRGNQIRAVHKLPLIDCGWILQRSLEVNYCIMERFDIDSYPGKCIPESGIPSR